MSIQQVPRDVLLYTFSYLSFKDALKIKSVCKDWYDKGEQTAKDMIVKKINEFQEMVNRTSSLFKKMTGKSVDEFIPELNKMVNLSPCTSKTLHERFEKIPIIKVQCRVHTWCWLSFVSTEKFRHEFKVEMEGKHYIHISIDDDGSKSGEYDFFKDIFHFPKALFEINEGNETAFPLKGRLVVFKAHQSNGTFEEAIKSLNPINGTTNALTSYYVWQRDAKLETEKS